MAPFPIQELTLPVATKGHDVIGQARTGTGKTLAFALALLGRVTPGGGTQALVIVPTRELCIQVAEEMQIGKALGLRTIAVYGGVGYEEQEAAFREGHEIVVGTPGRLLDHLNKRNLRLDGVTELVLDEADEMLDMGFLPDVERLIEACNDDRHGMLFSATMPTEVVKLARRYLDHPTFMRADHEVVQTAPNVTQHFFQVHRMDKPRVLARILQSPDRGGVYVFVRTKHMADRLVRELEDLVDAGDRHPRRPAPGDPREEPRQVPRRVGDRAGRHRGGRPWTRRRERHPRRQLRLPRRREDVPAPHRPHGPRGQQGRRGHLRRVQRDRPPERGPQEARPGRQPHRGRLLDLRGADRALRPAGRAPVGRARRGGQGRDPHATARATDGDDRGGAGGRGGKGGRGGGRDRDGGSRKAWRAAVRAPRRAVGRRRRHRTRRGRDAATRVERRGSPGRREGRRRRQPSDGAPKSTAFERGHRRDDRDADRSVATVRRDREQHRPTPAMRGGRDRARRGTTSTDEA